MEITVLASGSKGNATLVQIGNKSILIDAGISYLQLQKRLALHQINIKRIDAVLITHEHGDHIKGLDVLLRKDNPHLFITEHTLIATPEKIRETISSSVLHVIKPYEKFLFDELEILPFSVSHDSSDAVGFIFYNNGKKFVYCTDVGYLPDRDFELLRGANAYVFEANYDVTLLFTSARPFYLKQRIDSVKGHMSNTDSAYNMASLVGVNTKYIVLAHPSEECNTKELALETYKEVFQEYDKNIDDYIVLVASQTLGANTIKL